MKTELSSRDDSLRSIAENIFSPHLQGCLISYRSKEIYHHFISASSSDLVSMRPGGWGQAMIVCRHYSIQERNRNCFSEISTLSMMNARDSRKKRRKSQIPSLIQAKISSSLWVRPSMKVSSVSSLVGSPRSITNRPSSSTSARAKAWLSVVWDDLTISMSWRWCSGYKKNLSDSDPYPTRVSWWGLAVTNKHEDFLSISQISTYSKNCLSNIPTTIYQQHKARKYSHSILLSKLMSGTIKPSMKWRSSNPLDKGTKNRSSSSKIPI